MCAAGAATAVKASGLGTAQIVVGPVLDIEAAETSFYLRVGGPAEAVPPRSFILIQGLPPAVELSGAERAGPGTWVVSLSSLEDLTVKAPAGFVGGSDIVITLFDGAGTELAVRDVHLYAKDRFVTGPDSQQAEGEPSRQSEITTGSLSPPAAGPGVQAEASPPRSSIASPAPIVGPAAPSDATLPRVVPSTTASLPPPVIAPVPPVAAHKPSPTPDQLAQAERLLEQGRSSFGQGNISVARQYFSRAADLGLPIAALRMAETYDPHELERAKVHGPKANAATAAQWYRRAAQFGVPEAEDRLRRLGGQ
jgi:hypothetical protein